jgi:hypothetical protein
MADMETTLRPKVGDVLAIWITGMIGDYRACVVEVPSEGALVLRVLLEDDQYDPSWPPLKPGDYIVTGPADAG